MHTEDGRLRLSIEDDGIGISSFPDSGGMGLQIMSFRARMIGGSLNVQRTNSAGGTLVSCLVPVASFSS
jgi:two-component system sensor kinase FixL